jgi:hypothetical protein
MIFRGYKQNDLRLKKKIRQKFESLLDNNKNSIKLNLEGEGAVC